MRCFQVCRLKPARSRKRCDSGWPFQARYMGIVFQSTVLLPCPFTGPKMFCVGPNILSQSRNLTAFSASSKTFVLAENQFY